MATCIINGCGRQATEDSSKCEICQKTQAQAQAPAPEVLVQLRVFSQHEDPVTVLLEFANPALSSPLSIASSDPHSSHAPQAVPLANPAQPSPLSIASGAPPSIHAPSNLDFTVKKFTCGMSGVPIATELEKYLQLFSSLEHSSKIKPQGPSSPIVGLASASQEIKSQAPSSQSVVPTFSDKSTLLNSAYEDFINKKVDYFQKDPSKQKKMIFLVIGPELFHDLGAWPVLYTLLNSTFLLEPKVAKASCLLFLCFAPTVAPSTIRHFFERMSERGNQKWMQRYQGVILSFSAFNHNLTEVLRQAEFRKSLSDQGLWIEPESIYAVMKEHNQFETYQKQLDFEHLIYRQTWRQTWVDDAEKYKNLLRSMKNYYDSVYAQLENYPLKMQYRDGKHKKQLRNCFSFTEYLDRTQEKIRGFVLAPQGHDLMFIDIDSFTKSEYTYLPASNLTLKSPYVIKDEQDLFFCWIVKHSTSLEPYTPTIDAHQKGFFSWDCLKKTEPGELMQGDCYRAIEKAREYHNRKLRIKDQTGNESHQQEKSNYFKGRRDAENFPIKIWVEKVTSHDLKIFFNSLALHFYQNPDSKKQRIPLEFILKDITIEQMASPQYAEAMNSLAAETTFLDTGFTRQKGPLPPVHEAFTIVIPAAWSIRASHFSKLHHSIPRPESAPKIEVVQCFLQALPPGVQFRFESNQNVFNQDILFLMQFIATGSRVSCNKKPIFIKDSSLDSYKRLDLEYVQTTLFRKPAVSGPGPGTSYWNEILGFYDLKPSAFPYTYYITRDKPEFSKSQMQIWFKVLKVLKDRPLLAPPLSPPSLAKIVSESSGNSPPSDNPPALAVLEPEYGSLITELNQAKAEIAAIERILLRVGRRTNTETPDLKSVELSDTVEPIVNAWDDSFARMAEQQQVFAA